jgi:imidazolonepropionase
MPGFVDPGVRVTLQPKNLIKRRKMMDFRADTLTLLRACMHHGTLNLRICANGGKGDLRTDILALRQLASIANPPVGAIQSWRIAPEQVNGSAASFQDFVAALKLVGNRDLAQSIEMTPESSEALGSGSWEAAGESGLAVNLLWPGGSPDLLKELLARTNPGSVWCPSSLSREECSVLAHSPSIAVFCPGRELLEERGGDAVRCLIDSGAAVALSSGYDATDAPTFSMQTALSLAVLRLRLSTEEAISAATINAAHAVGSSHLVGSIECGKRADLLVLNVPDYREIPRRFGINNVVMAIREGNLMYNRTRWKVSTS